jgi:hypothetical protein
MRLSRSRVDYVFHLLYLIADVFGLAGCPSKADIDVVDVFLEDNVTECRNAPKLPSVEVGGTVGLYPTDRADGGDDPVGSLCRYTFLL